MPRKKNTTPMPSWVRLVREPLSDHERATFTAKGCRIREPADLVKILTPRLAGEEVEVFLVVTLDSQSQVLNLHEVTRGLLNSCLVHPREVYRRAVADGAAGIIVAHNHPSGDPTPSAEDRAITRQLTDAGRLLDLPLYDHLIIAGERSTSFASAGLL